jgi:hypothetical protein
VRARAHPVRGQGSAHLGEVAAGIEERSFLRPGAADVGPQRREVVVKARFLEVADGSYTSGSRSAWADPEHLAERTRRGGQAPRSTPDGGGSQLPPRGDAGLLVNHTLPGVRNTTGQGPDAAGAPR